MSAFTPPRWLRNPHAQTLIPALLRRRPPVRLREQPLELPDGDCLRLVWGPGSRQSPLVVILHGLGGCADSGYVRGLMQALQARGLASVVMQFRGAGGWANRLDRFYHAAATEDLDATIDWLRRRQPGRPLALAGFSLGASIALNWLAARGSGAPVGAAAAVSPPFDLAACADHIERGFARLYQWDLLRSLKRMVRGKYAGRADAPIALAELQTIATLRQFDDRLTAPLHGFGSAARYYAEASCGPRLARIRQPTLIVHAEDDPFIPASAIPPAAALGPAVRLELHRHGGHVGFVAGATDGGMHWLERRLADYLAEQLATPAAATG